MDTEILEEFITLAVEKSYISAANKLHMSHTTLHRHITSLEKDLGKKLILRTNPIALTVVGRLVLEKASSITYEVENMRRQVLEERADIVGQMNVLDVSPQYDVLPLLSRTLYRVKTRYPKISFTLIGPSENLDIVQAVLQGQLDIAFRHHYRSLVSERSPEEQDAELDTPGITRVMLNVLSFRLRFGVNRSHPLFGVSEAPFEEIARHGIILPSNKTYEDSTNAFVRFCTSEGYHPQFLHVETNGLLEMWLNYSGKGAFVLTESMLPHHILPVEFFENLQLITPAGDNFLMCTYAIYNDQIQNDAKMVTLDSLATDLNE